VSTRRRIPRTRRPRECESGWLIVVVTACAGGSIPAGSAVNVTTGAVTVTSGFANSRNRVATTNLPSTVVEGYGTTALRVIDTLTRDLRDSAIGWQRLQRGPDG
jgi:hypothetical protein